MLYSTLVIIALHRHVTGADVGRDVGLILVYRFLKAGISTERITALRQELAVQVDGRRAVRGERQDALQELLIRIRVLQRL